MHEDSRHDCRRIARRAAPRCRRRRRARGKLNVVTTPRTWPRSRARSAATRSRSTSLARGYQDPHFVEAKPSFILKLHKRRPARSWSAASWRSAGCRRCIDAEPQRQDPAGRRRLPRRLADARRSSTSRPAQITRAMGDVHPLGNPHYWLDPENGRAHRAGRSQASCRSSTPADAAYFAAALRRLRQAARPRRRSAGRRRWRLQGHRRSSPITAPGRTSPTRFGLDVDRLRRAASRASRRRRRTRSTSSTR